MAHNVLLGIDNAGEMVFQSFSIVIEDSKGIKREFLPSCSRNCAKNFTVIAMLKTLSTVFVERFVVI